MEIVHTAIRVSDIERTDEFYTDVLDLEYSREFERDGTRNYFVAGDGGVELQFVQSASPGDCGPKGYVHVALRVDALDDALERVESADLGGVREGPQRMDDVRIAFVEDPDGYEVELIEQS